jgi:tetratricopeptide (TPR) repeat protein
MNWLKYFLLSMLLASCAVISAQEKICDSLLNKLNSEVIDSTRCKIMLNLGDYYKQINKDSVLFYYKGSIRLAEKSQLPVQQITACLNLGAYYLILSDYQSAIECFRSSYEINSKLKDKKYDYSIYSNMGMYYHYTTSFDSAAIFYSKALNSARETSSKKDVSDIFNKLGSLNSDRGNYPEAINYYNQAITISKEINDEKSLARYYNNLSIVYQRQGSYEQALEYAFSALRLLEKQNYQYGVASCLINIGNIYTDQKEFDKSVEYFQKALSVHSRLGNQKNVFDCLNNLGNIFQYINKPDSASKFYEQAIIIANQINYLNGASIVYNNLASILTDQGKYNSAIEYYQKAIDIAFTLDDKNSLVIRYFNISSLLLKQARQTTDNIERSALLQKAFKFATKGASINKQLNSTMLLNEEEKLYMQLYAETGDFKKAYSYSQQYIVTHDSMFSEEKTEAIANAEKKYELEKKQFEIDKLNNETKLQKLELEKARTQKVFLLIVISLFVISTILIVYLRKRRQDLLYQKQLSYITQLRMASIRNRMSPHFFFNALGSMSSLVAEPELVQKKIQDLTILLRKTIEHIDQVTLPLEEELEIVESYIDLYHEKFDGNLDFKVTIDNLVDRKLLVPSMILQIPVENAIKHGLMPLQNNERKLTIDIEQKNDYIAINVDDNGIGLKNAKPVTSGTGTGLKTILQTIHLLNLSNKEKISLKLVDRYDENSQLKGARTEIRIPINYFYSN